MPNDIPSLLLRCESEGLARAYVVGGGDFPKIVEYDGEGREVLVVSDLHVAAGIGSDGRYGGTENFFDDKAFARFVDHYRAEIAPGKGLLVINGDFIDFLRIIDVPQKDDDAAFYRWRQELTEIGIDKSVAELQASISDKEREFGFKTHDFKSAWRLWRSVEGHREIFLALARWLADGQKLIVVKGNHDLEWYWLAVRNALRLEMAKMIVAVSGADLRKTLEETVLPNIDFIDDAMVIDTDLYIEHGHRYDRYAFVLGDPALPNGEELNIPFGSFFNRYLLNGLEATYPYLDNIRPGQNLLPLLIRERFPLALRVLFAHIPFMLRIIPKQYYHYMFSRFLTIVLTLLAPIVAGIGIIYFQYPDFFSSLLSPAHGPESHSIWHTIAKGAINLLGNTGWLVLSYILTRLLAQFQLEEPSSLNTFGAKILGNPDYRVVTMGHTHNPDQFDIGGRWFYNTGTWIPIIETSSAALREDEMFCFIRLYRNEAGRLLPGLLHRWNDSAERPDPLTIMRET